MADIVSSFVVEETLGRVISLITNEISLAWNLKGDLEKLQKSLTMIRAVLQDAEEQQTTSESVRLWLNKLKDVAYEAEDVFDELTYETLRKKVSEFNPSVKRTFVKKAAFRVKMAHKVKKINESLGKIKNEAVGFGLRCDISGNRIAPQVNLDRVTDSVISNPIVGRETDLSKVVNLLTDHSRDQQSLTIVPIVGMGGLGKTALAKLVCQEVMGSNIFDVKLWVCVSENVNEQKILGEMLQFLNPTMGGLTNRDAILQELENSLGKRTVFLVLDDVWENISRCWVDLRCWLLRICNSKGNSVLVTTRSEEVASIVESSSQLRHRLGLLSDDDCWFILNERAYGGTTIPSNLESIGREIARKCKGVPLAAKVLGGTLALSGDDESAWVNIRDSNVFNVADNKENVGSILKLSFDQLPPYLKSCFAFCSVFPKDFLFEKEQLIQLWIAEGFVESCDAKKGSKYFNALLRNSFFQDAERNETTGDVIRCKMHDLVHDLALSLCKSETLNSENYSVTSDASGILRLLADDKVVKTLVADEKFQSKKLRTLILDGAPLPGSWKLESLRSLILRGDDVEELPSSIGKLIHLRHLDFSNTKIKAWPKSIGMLFNLQTLKFRECKELPQLPRDEISNMISLKHIDFSWEKQMPAGLGRLSCLEKLPFFVVGPDYGGSIGELECLNELTGRLSITALKNVKDKEEAERANLSRKAKLEALDFGWSDFSTNNCLEVIEGLRPHPNIKSIKIDYYLGEKFPSWFSGMKSSGDVNSSPVLNNLVKLNLYFCIGCEQLPELGNLPCLKHLKVLGFLRLEKIGNEFYGVGGGCRLFPALKSLSLGEMCKLVEWRAPDLGDEVGDKVVVFPCIEELSINACPKLKNIPLTDIIPSLIKLEIDGCEAFESIFDEIQLSFPSLTSLTLHGFKKLTCIPNSIYSNKRIEHLDISSCDQLTFISEDLGKLSSLTSLKIDFCSSLSYFPENILCKLIRLERLWVGGFSNELNHFRYLNSIQDLPFLKELRIIGSKQHSIMSLPDQLQGLTTLQSLVIYHFRMEALPEWLLNLQSLQSLEINFCDNLQYESTAKLFRRLSSLRYVYICDSSFFEDESGRWSKFSRATKIKVLSESRVSRLVDLLARPFGGFD